MNISHIDNGFIPTNLFNRFQFSGNTTCLACGQKFKGIPELTNHQYIKKHFGCLMCGDVSIKLQLLHSARDVTHSACYVIQRIDVFRLKFFHILVLIPKWSYWFKSHYQPTLLFLCAVKQTSTFKFICFVIVTKNACYSFINMFYLIIQQNCIHTISGIRNV